SGATRIRTSRSGAASTSAWERTSRASRCGSSSRSCSRPSRAGRSPAGSSGRAATAIPASAACRSACAEASELASFRRAIAEPLSLQDLARRVLPYRRFDDHRVGIVAFDREHSLGSPREAVLGAVGGVGVGRPALLQRRQLAAAARQHVVLLL